MHLDKQFAQILNKADSQWVTVSNNGCGPGEVNMFDSWVENSTYRQIAFLLFTEENTHHTAILIHESPTSDWYIRLRAIHYHGTL